MGLLLSDGDLFEFVRATLANADLRVTPASVASALRLPDRSRRFLTEIGLPAQEVGPGLDFNLVEMLPTPREAYAGSRFQFGAAWENTRMLRLRHEVGIYLNLADGSVWELVPEAASEARFVNSSVEMLGYFLAESSRPGGAWQSSDRNAVGEAFDTMVCRMRAADPDAFDDEGDNFWSLVIEDARNFI